MVKYFKLHIVRIGFISGLIACMQFSTVFGQLLSNNGQEITMTGGVVVAVLGGAINSGTINNKGELYLKGDWNNKGHFIGNQGSLILFDESEQTIDHQGKEIGNLIIEGGGKKSLISDIIVSNGGSFDLINGLIVSNDSAAIFLEDDVSVVFGSSTAYVDGPLFHIGDGVKLFPIGKGGIYSPIELENVQGVNSIIGFEVFNFNPDPVRDYELSKVSTIRHWRKTELNAPGEFQGSIIKLFANSDESFPFIDELAVGQSDSLGGFFVNLGQSMTEGTIGRDGWVTSQHLAKGNIFALTRLSGVSLDQLVFVPNALAPSSSNAEEQVAKVYAQDVDDMGFVFKIFDRWGSIVFETTSFEEANTIGWKGLKNGRLADDGVYQYILKGQFLSGRKFDDKGKILLLK